MFKYCVSVLFNHHTDYIGTESYVMSWEIYRAMEAMYPEDAIIDIIDMTTGEIFQSNDPNF